MGPTFWHGIINPWICQRRRGGAYVPYSCTNKICLQEHAYQPKCRVVYKFGTGACISSAEQILIVKQYFLLKQLYEIVYRFEEEKYFIQNLPGWNKHNVALWEFVPVAGQFVENTSYIENRSPRGGPLIRKIRPINLNKMSSYFNCLFKRKFKWLSEVSWCCLF